MLTRYPQIVAGTHYFEREGSPSITADERGVTGVRVFRVAGASLTQFVAAMRGSPAIEDAPEALPGFPTIMCVSANAEPVKGSKGLSTAFTGGGLTPVNPAAMTAEWWTVTCRFEVPGAISYDFAGEGLSLPTGNLGWLGDNKPIAGMGLVTTVPNGDLTMTRRNVPQLVPNRIMGMIGKVNAADFSPAQVDLNWRRRVGLTNTEIYPAATLQDATIAPGCAMFLGAKTDSVVDPLGYMSHDITYKFAVRPEAAPWNKFYRVEKATATGGFAGRWEYLYVKGNESQIALELYPPADFNGLFT